MEFKVVFTATADQQLQEIEEYIRSREGSPEPAATFAMRLVSAALSLMEFPYRGRVFNRRRKLRRVCFGNYLIVYQVKAEERMVEVLGFVHGARIKRRGRLPRP